MSSIHHSTSPTRFNLPTSQPQKSSLSHVQFGGQASHTQPAKDSLHFSGKVSITSSRAQSLIQAYQNPDSTEVDRLLDFRSREEQAILLVQAYLHGNVGSLPLFTAARLNNPEAITNLINAHTMVNQTDIHGQKPRRWITTLLNKNTFVNSLKKHLFVNSQSSRGYTPLHVAAFWGNTDAVTALINGGANVNKTSFEGDAPLHFATNLGRTDIITALINGGADINKRNKEGLTPYQLLETNIFNPTINPRDQAQYLQAASLLVAHGANPHDKLPKEIRDKLDKYALIISANQNPTYTMV
jgi:ankyrin repeat protein